MEVLTRCPPFDELLNYLHDRLGRAADAALTDHIQTCRKCEQTLSSLVAPIRPAKPADSLACAMSPRLAARLRQLWASRPADARVDCPEEWPAIAGFEILGVLGRGGMGVVYHARQIELDREVAIKMLLPGRLTSADGRRLLHDAATASRLQHPNVVPVYHVGQHQGLPFFVMELIAGGSLAQRLQETVEEPRQVARLVAQVARALDHAHHHGVCHRDVKSANVMLRVRREREAGCDHSLSTLAAVDACLTDFGLAKRSRGDPGLTLDGTILGTPGYMAPEQVRSEHPLPASDVYGLGAVLFECLTGQSPFHGATTFDTLLMTLNADLPRPRTLSRQLPRDLETVCLKALEKEPSRRYPTAAALADDLERWLRGEPVRARPVGPVGRGWRWCRRKPVSAGLAAALVLSLIAGLGASLWLWRQAAENETQARESLTNELAARRDADEKYALLQRALNYGILNLSSPIYATPEADPQRLAVLRDADATLSELLARQPEDARLRMMLARTSTMLGALHHLQHNDPAAVAAFERAVALWEQVAAEDADRSEHRAWQSIAYICLEQAYDRQGRAAEADRGFAAAVAIWGSLLRRDPTFQYQDNLFAAVINLRSLVIPNQPVEPDPPTRFKTIRARLELAAGPDERDFFNAVVRLAYLWPKAELYARTKHPDDLLTVAREAADLLTKLLPRASLEPAYRVYLASKSLHVSGWLRRAGRNADAMRVAVTANCALTDLLRRSPDDPVLLRFLSETWHAIGKVHWDLDQTEETLAAGRQAVETQRRLVEVTPADPDARTVLGARHMQLGRKYCELGQIEEAEACFVARDALWPGDRARHVEAIKELRKWADETGSNRERQRYLELCSRLERREISPRSP